MFVYSFTSPPPFFFLLLIFCFFCFCSFFQGGGRGVDWVSSFSRFILLYLAFSFFFRQPAQKQPLEEGVEVGGGEVGVVEKKGELFYSNHFSFGDVIKSRVYLSEEEGFHEGDEVFFLLLLFPPFSHSLPPLPSP